MSKYIIDKSLHAMLVHNKEGDSDPILVLQGMFGAMPVIYKYVESGWEVMEDDPELLEMGRAHFWKQDE